MHAGNLCNIVQCKIVCSDCLIWKVGKHFDMLWSNTWVSKVNKTTFASDMFRVFLFSSPKKLNWLLKKSLFRWLLFCTLVSRTVGKLDFFFYSAVSAPAYVHGLHTHCKQSLCEPGVKDPSHIQLMKSGLCVCKLLCNNCTIVKTKMQWTIKHLGDL